MKSQPLYLSRGEEAELSGLRQKQQATGLPGKRKGLPRLSEETFLYSGQVAHLELPHL